MYSISLHRNNIFSWNYFFKESSWWALFNHLKIANFEKWWLFTLGDTLNTPMMVIILFPLRGSYTWNKRSFFMCFNKFFLLTMSCNRFNKQKSRMIWNNFVSERNGREISGFEDTRGKFNWNKWSSILFINEEYLALFSFRSDLLFKGSKPLVLYICN